MKDKNMRKRMPRTVYLFIALISICTLFSCASEAESRPVPPSDNPPMEEKESLRASVKNGDYEIIFLLNDSPAAISFYAQLPLTTQVENYGSNEKIFYPAEKLITDNSPMLDCPAGTLAYFAPWGNAVMYYGDAPKYNGLYYLGTAVKGKEFISHLSGKLTVTKAILIR